MLEGHTVVSWVGLWLSRLRRGDKAATRAICSVNIDFITHLDKSAVRLIWCEKSCKFEVQEKWYLGSMCFCSASAGD